MEWYWWLLIIVGHPIAGVSSEILENMILKDRVDPRNLTASIFAGYLWMLVTIVWTIIRLYENMTLPDGFLDFSKPRKVKPKPLPAPKPEKKERETVASKLDL